VPPEHRSSALHVNQRLYADRAAAAEVGARIREVLQSAKLEALTPVRRD
jgi:hypothetical protein